MHGKIEGKTYDAEFRGLFHNYKVVAESIPNFEGIEKFINKY